MPKTIIVLFLIGAGLQVFGEASQNMQHGMYGAQPMTQLPPRVVVGHVCWVNKQAWINTVVDVASIASFFIAILRLMDVFLKR